MIALNTPIEKLGYVGPRNAPRLRRLGIKTVRDLLWHFPSRYEDFSQVMSIADVRNPGEVVSIHGVITKLEVSRSWKRHMTIVNAFVDDGTDTIRVVWFNQPYLERTLPEGTQASLSGKVSLDKNGLYLSSPSYEKIGKTDSDLAHTGRLVPIYPETEGVTSKYLRFLIKRVLPHIKDISDPIPKEILEKYTLPDISKAIKSIHFPEKDEEADIARYRFAFEELFLFQLKALSDRQKNQELSAPHISFNESLISEFVKSLPFQLTNDQRIATFEILKDLQKPHPMNRLLNGDVGSGKTVVALIAAYQSASNNYQAVFMAPTEILAKQHFQTITKLLPRESGITVGLLTGTESRQFPSDIITEEKVSKKLLTQKISAGKISIIIGTHAVIQKGVDFKNLGLVIIDEQHRFGIEQRMKLVKGNGKPNLIPHLLSMTATPIPRTLALTVYGDLDVSLLKQKPKGRIEIITKAVSNSEKEKYYRFTDDHISKGRQVFVICPRIEISKPEDNDRIEQHKKPLSQAKLIWSEVKAVTEEYEKLKKEIFPHRRVEMLHGKMKPKEKNEIMKGFKDGDYDILVSTSVIEVGVDIPNASIMLIESAERFGLAQLHQFRGRIGRGEHQSYCFLFTSMGSSTTRRLQALEKISNGFELAEMDLKIRGPGEFTGLKQSGIPDLAMSSLTDIDLIKKARTEAQTILSVDPTLNDHDELSERLKLMRSMVHFE